MFAIEHSFLCCGSKGTEQLNRSSYLLKIDTRQRAPAGALPFHRNETSMVEAVVLWNEPNNLSHWNFKLDPDWERFADMVRLGSKAIRAVNPTLPIVLGGVSACDCDFLRLMVGQGVIEHVDVVGTWIPARLEPLADKRVACEDCRSSRGFRQAGVGARGGRFIVWR
jgi:hypothetical protein